MRTRRILLPAVLCCAIPAAASAAVTIVSTTRRIEATSASHQCSDGFPGAVGQTLVSTNTDTGQFTQSVQPTSIGTPWGSGSAGINSFIGSGGVSLPSFWAAVNNPTAGGCIISSSTARSARVSMTVTFLLDEPTAYIFTGSLTQNNFSSGFSGSRSYGLNFAGMGFSGSFIDGGGNPGAPGPDDSRSISRQGVLPAGTYTFSASINVDPQAPPSFSSSTFYQMQADLQFIIPEPSAAALLLLTLGAATAVRRRPPFER